MLKEHQDAYGREIYDYWTGDNRFEIVERIDGYIQVSDYTPALYFADFENWPAQEKEAMQYVQGRVLDIGCGAGRVGLYLQEKGCDYLGIDSSPLALEVCRQRGVKNLRLISISQVNSKLGRFDTIILFGNNFGLFGSFQQAKRLLRKFYRLTSDHARILAASTDVYSTQNPFHLEYHEYNRQRGRMAGQLRLRIRYLKYATPWFDYLIVSKEEMSAILSGTGWQVVRFIQEQDNPSYVAVIEKEPV